MNIVGVCKVCSAEIGTMSYHNGTGVASNMPVTYTELASGNWRCDAIVFCNVHKRVNLRICLNGDVEEEQIDGSWKKTVTQPSVCNNATTVTIKRVKRVNQRNPMYPKGDDWR